MFITRSAAAILPVLCLLWFTAGMATADLIPGAPQELSNPGFETGDLSSWTVVGIVTVGTPGHTGNWAAGLRGQDGQEGQIRQVADDKTNNPLWNDDYSKKKVDLNAWVAIFGEAKVSFRLDYYKSLDDTPPTGAADFTTQWVDYTASTPGITAGQWSYVNPFKHVVWDFQPRWISVEVKFSAPGQTDAVGVDDLALSGQCVPAPAGSFLVLQGIAILTLARTRNQPCRRR